MADTFERTRIIRVGERLFEGEGTDEKTVLLLAEGFSVRAAGHVENEYVDTLKDLEEAVLVANAIKSNVRSGTGQKPIRDLLLPSVEQLLAKIDARPQVVKFGDIATILIGVVTGANQFFVVNKLKADQWKLPAKFQKPILSKFGMTSGLTWKKSDWDSLKKDGKRCIFIKTSGFTPERDKELAQYLDSFPEVERETNATFSARRVWHQPQNITIPDAFLPYMLSTGPRIVLNEARSVCTNTIHKVFFKVNPARPLTETDRKAICISILGTFSQLLAEIEGRTYGSGVLKLEPSEAGRIKLFVLTGLDEKVVDDTFNLISDILQGRVDSLGNDSISDCIRRLADDFIAQNTKVPQLANKFKKLERALTDLRAKRSTIVSIKD